MSILDETPLGKDMYGQQVRRCRRSIRFDLLKDEKDMLKSQVERLSTRAYAPPFLLAKPGAEPFQSHVIEYRVIAALGHIVPFTVKV
jgi:hypothetical protein